MELISRPPGSCRACGHDITTGGMSHCAACVLSLAVHGRSADPTDGGGLEGMEIGGYVLGEKLGEGGFAEVHAARRIGDAHPFPVAMKVMRRGMNSREVLGRFAAEQRVLRHLEHPGIVRVMESGMTADGRSYFLMEQVDGLPVTEFCQVARLPVRERLGLFAAVCDAVQYAHQKAVLHRDLKPGNILVAEMPDGPQPKVIDFGIAKALEPGGTGETLATMQGQVLGTPAYISPEQAAGTDEADTRSDIYSLGAVCYEMLTGEPPWKTEEFRRLPVTEWSRRLREGTVVPPSVCARQKGDAPLAKVLSGDLDQVILKAMAPEPELRYAAASALAEDVRAWLRGEPVSARAPSLRRVLGRFMRRHRWQSVAALSVLTAILVGAGAAVSVARRSREAEQSMSRERDRARLAETAAGVARARAQAESYQSALHLARLLIENGEYYLAGDRLRQTLPELRGWEWRALMGVLPRPPGAAESGLADASALAASRDGQFAAVASARELAVLDLSSGAAVCRLPLRDGVTQGAMALTPAGDRLAFLEAGQLRVVALPSGTQLWQKPFPGPAAGVAWEPGGALLAVSGNSHEPAAGLVARFSGADGSLLTERSIHRWKVAGEPLLVHPSGKTALIRTSFATVTLVSLPALTTVTEMPAELTTRVQCLTAVEGPDRFLTANLTQIVEIPCSGGPVRPVGMLGPETGKGPLILRLNTLEDGRWVASGSAKQLTEKETQTVPCPQTAERSAVNIPGGRRVALLSGGRVEIRAEANAEFFKVPLAFGPAGVCEYRRVAVSADAAWIAGQAWDRRELIVVHRESLAQTPLWLDPPDGAEWSLLPVWHPDGSLICNDGPRLVRCGISLNDAGLPAAAEPEPLPAPDAVWSAAPSADGVLVALAGMEGVSFLEWKSRRLTGSITLKGAPFHVLAESSGSGFLVLSAAGLLHRVEPGKSAAEPILTISPEAGTRPPVAAWNAEHGLLAVARGPAVTVWRILPGSLPAEAGRLTLESRVTALAFDPEGRRLAIADSGMMITIHDWSAALPLLPLHCNTQSSSLCYSPDGSVLVNADFGPPIRIWTGNSVSPAAGMPFRR